VGGGDVQVRGVTTEQLLLGTKSRTFRESMSVSSLCSLSMRSLLMACFDLSIFERLELIFSSAVGSSKVTAASALRFRELVATASCSSFDTSALEDMALGTRAVAERGSLMPTGDDSTLCDPSK